MLESVYHCYRRPILISETSAEDQARAEWLTYMTTQARQAMARGVLLEGICIYPIVNFPAWEDGRLSQNGLWGYPDETGYRGIYQPMAEALRQQQQVLIKQNPIQKAT